MSAVSFIQDFDHVCTQDMLRGHYQQLSFDPNSLANLDQGTCTLKDHYFLSSSWLGKLDLPNNLQREVPIVSSSKALYLIDR